MGQLIHLLDACNQIQLIGWTLTACEQKVLGPWVKSIKIVQEYTS